MDNQNVTPVDEQRSQLREYLGILRFRKWSLILVTLIVVGAVVAWSARQRPKYEAESRVFVQSVAISGTEQRAEGVNLDTEREILSSSTVIAQGVLDKFDLEFEPHQLLRNLAVEVIHRTEVLSIKFQSPDPVLARQGADGFARGYLQQRKKQVLTEIKAAQESLTEQIATLEGQLTEAREEAEAVAPESVEGAEAEAQVSALETTITNLETKLGEIVDPTQVRVGYVSLPAVLPSDPVSPDHVRNGILGLFLGLFLGVGVAFLRERLDDRLRGRADLEQKIGAPVLAVVPRIGSWRKRADTPISILAEPKSAAAEAYRTLRTSLQFAASQKEMRTILVASAHQGEGKTSTCANLAVALAQAHKRVILVSADLRKPRIHRFFGVTNEGGLTSVLTKEVKPWEALHTTTIDYLKVMASGPVPGNPAELLGSEAMRALLRQLREVADFLVIDSAPVLAAADALAMASFVDAVLILADSERTTRGAVEQCRILLEQVQAPIVGAVLNNFDPSKARAYQYYYGAYYYYYEAYGEDGEGKPAGRRRGRGSRPSRKSRRHRGQQEPALTPAGAPSKQWGFEPAVPVTTPGGLVPPEEPAEPVTAPGEPALSEEPAPTEADWGFEAPRTEGEPGNEPALAEPVAPQPQQPVAPQPQPQPQRPVEPQPQPQPPVTPQPQPQPQPPVTPQPQPQPQPPVTPQPQPQPQPPVTPQPQPQPQPPVTPQPQPQRPVTPQPQRQEPVAPSPRARTDSAHEGRSERPAFPEAVQEPGRAAGAPPAPPAPQRQPSPEGSPRPAPDVPSPSPARPSPPAEPPPASPEEERAQDSVLFGTHEPGSPRPFSEELEDEENGSAPSEDEEDQREQPAPRRWFG